jgi:phosphoribosylformylglycinamidine cyclo-ligase
MKLRMSSRVAGLKGPIGEELLKVHVSYGPLVQNLLKRFNHSRRRAIKGLAHITGGGFVDNIPRVLPDNCDVVIRKGSWEMLPIFQLIQERGKVAEPELYRVFNMGIGMTVVVSAEAVTSVLRLIRTQKHDAWIIGEVTRGQGRARIAG